MFSIKQKALVGSCVIFIKTVTHVAALTLAWDLLHCLCYITLLCTLSRFFKSIFQVICRSLFLYSPQLDGLCRSLCRLCTVQHRLWMWRESALRASASPTRVWKGYWQWPRSARTSRSSVFHWTWGLEVSGPSPPQRPRPALHVDSNAMLIFNMQHQWKSPTQVQCCVLGSQFQCCERVKSRLLCSCSFVALTLYCLNYTSNLRLCGLWQYLL